MNKILVISEDTIRTYSEISENVWGKSLLPAIRTAQDIELQGILGSCLYKKILSLIGDGSIQLDANIAYKDLLDEYVTPFMIEQVIADLIPIIGSKIANIGVYASSDEYVNNVPADEVDRLKYSHQVKADHYAKRMQTFLKANRQAFPELNNCKCGDVQPNLNSAEDCSIYLGGIRGRRIGKFGCC